MKLLKEKNKLHICSAVNSNSNTCWNSPELASNTWFNLRIRQQENASGTYTYQILIDGVIKRSLTNNNPMTFENVDGIIAHAYDRGYKTPNGRFQNFEFNSSE